MSMSKKDFILLATILRDIRLDKFMDDGSFRIMLRRISDALGMQYEDFDAKKFESFISHESRTINLKQSGR